jgi:hypothetical protein
MEKGFFLGVPKNPIFVGLRRIFFVVAIMSSITLIFLKIFRIKGRVTFNSSPKFGNAP